MRQLARSLCATSFVVLAGSSALFASDIRVPTDYATIQTAIDAAGTDDAVLVSPGTYRENVDFKGKAITVASVDGPSVTTIDGGLVGSWLRRRLDWTGGTARNNLSNPSQVQQ